MVQHQGSRPPPDEDMHARALGLAAAPTRGWSAMTSDISGVLGTLDPRIRPGTYPLMGLLTIVSAIVITPG